MIYITDINWKILYMIEYDISKIYLVETSYIMPLIPKQIEKSTINL